MDNFERCHRITEEWEGGWSNHRADPGGLTKWGVTLKLLQALRLDYTGDGHVDKADLVAMTPAQARRVYRRQFWDKIKADDLPLPVALVVYDAAVNTGPRRAAKFLQRSVGAKADGAIGPRTLAAVQRKYRTNPRRVLVEFSTRRMLHFTSLAIFAAFGRGWTRRLIDVAVSAAAMHPTHMDRA